MPIAAGITIFLIGGAVILGIIFVIVITSLLVTLGTFRLSDFTSDKFKINNVDIPEAGAITKINLAARSAANPDGVAAPQEFASYLGYSKCQIGGIPDSNHTFIGLFPITDKNQIAYGSAISKVRGSNVEVKPVYCF